MDHMDLERERGITIAAKNCSVTRGDTTINILDTPGHADFGGEVERALSMVDGAILLVDASEGPLPQTRFVLKKTLEAGLKVVVVINKIDRQDARPDEVLDEIYDLFIDLDANDEQLEFPLLYAIGRDGIAQKTLTEKGTNLDVLFELILNEIPPPACDPAKPLQMLVADLGYSDYLGRLAIGKISNGTVNFKKRLTCIDETGEPVDVKLSKLQVYEGLSLVAVDTAGAGDVAVLAGIDDVHIGDTICLKDQPLPLKRLTVDDPTVSMRFSISNSPFSGREGKIVQSRKIRDRLTKEAMVNVAVQVENTEEGDSFTVKGRGEFQMAILIETMRREGFELCVGRPKVILKKENGRTLEPMEQLFVDCAENFMGVVTEKLSLRKGKMVSLVNNGRGRVNLEFSIPTRSLIGYRDEFLTDTRGTGIMNSIFAGYGNFRGEFPSRYTGSLVSDRQGKAIPYALFNLEPRGQLFLEPGEPVYEGMIIGEHNKASDLNINPCKEKKLSNVRASGKDDAVVCSPIKAMTLERALSFVRDDELVEVTPKSIRLRKVVLSALKRKTDRYGGGKKK